MNIVRRVVLLWWGYPYFCTCSGLQMELVSVLRNWYICWLLHLMKGQINFWLRDALCALRVFAYCKMAVTVSCYIIKEKSVIWSVLLSDVTTSRWNVSRDRNERGLQLSMQNLKGVVSLFPAPQDIVWTKELKQQTSWWLEDAYATLTLMENDISHVPDADNSLREGFHVLLGCVQSLHSYINSYENNLTDNSAVLFAIQHAKRMETKGLEDQV